MILRVLTLLLLAGLSSRAEAACLIGCSAEPPLPEARAWLRAELAADLPPGVGLSHLLSGGFQDQFVQLRLTGPDTARPALLALLAAQEGLPCTLTGAADAPWWHSDGLTCHEITLGHFPYARLGIAADPQHPDHFLALIFAFET